MCGHYMLHYMLRYMVNVCPRGIAAEVCQATVVLQWPGYDVDCSTLSPTAGCPSGHSRLDGNSRQRPAAAPWMLVI